MYEDNWFTKSIVADNSWVYNSNNINHLAALSGFCWIDLFRIEIIDSLFMPSDLSLWILIIDSSKDIEPTFSFWWTYQRLISTNMISQYSLRNIIEKYVNFKSTFKQSEVN